MADTTTPPVDPKTTPAPVALDDIPTPSATPASQEPSTALSTPSAVPITSPNPLTTSRDPKSDAFAYQAQKNGMQWVSNLLEDPDRNAPDLKKWANQQYDPKAAMNMGVGMAVVSHLTGQTDAQIGDNYSTLRNQVAVSWGEKPPANDADFLAMAKTHITGQINTDKAYEDAYYQAFRDKLSGTQSNPATAEQEWSLKNGTALASGKTSPEDVHEAFSNAYAKGVNDANSPLFDLAHQTVNALSDKFSFKEVAEDLGEIPNAMFGGNPNQTDKDKFISGLTDKLADMDGDKQEQFFNLVGQIKKSQDDGMDPGSIKGWFTNLGQTLTRSTGGIVSDIETPWKRNLAEGTDIMLGDASEADKSKELNKIELAAKIKSAADNVVNPLHNYGTATDLARGVVGALPWVASFELGGARVGTALMGAANYGQNQNWAISQGMDVIKANAYAALATVPQTAAMSLSFGSVTAAMPWMEQRLASMTGGKLLNYVAHTGTAIAGMDAADISNITAQSIAQLFTPKGEDKTPGTDKLVDLIMQQPERAATFALLSAPSALRGHYKDAELAAGVAKIAQDEQGLRQWGLSNEQISEVQNTPVEKLPSLLASLGAEMTAKATADGKELAKTDNMLARLKAESPETPNMIKLDNGNYRLLVPDGKGGLAPAGDTPDINVATARLDKLNEYFMNNRITHFNALVDYFENVWKGQGIENREVSTEFDPNRTVQDQLDRGESDKTPEQAKHSVEIALPGENTSLSQAFVDGWTKGEWRNNIYHDVIKVLDYGPQTFIHEASDAATKRAIAQGKITKEDLVGWIRKTEAGMKAIDGKDHLYLLPEHENDEEAIIEANTKVLLDYAGGKFAAYKAAPSALRGFFKTMMAYFTHVLSRAKVLHQAINSGAVPAEYENHLAQTLGLPIDSRLAPGEAKATADLIGARVSDATPAVGPASLAPATRTLAEAIRDRDVYRHGNDEVKLVGQNEEGVIARILRTNQEILLPRGEDGGNPSGIPDLILVKKGQERIGGSENYSIRSAVAPVRTDRLKELKRAEMLKRENSAKYQHLQQVTNDVADAYGIKILDRKAQIEGWGEKGELSTEVPEHVVFDTDDMEVAKEMAAIIGATAPDLQNATMLWREHDGGVDHQFSFQVKPGKADVVAAGLESGGMNGFSYDPKTRTFSLVFKETQDEDTQKVKAYVELQRTQGNISARASVEGFTGTAEFPNENEYRGILQKARDRASEIGGEQGDKIISVVDRAERRIEKYEADKLAAAQATEALSKLETPYTSTTAILKDLNGRQFENIRELAQYLDARFKEKNGFGMFKLGSKEGRNSASDSLVHDILTGLSKNGSGSGWYDERVRETLHELSKMHPEFEKDPDSMAVYIGILASTSQGYTVTENFKQAEKVFAEYKRTGRIPSHFEFAKSNDPINQNLKFMQDMIDEHGLSKFREFMDSEVTGQQLRDIHGLEPQGVTLKDTVRGSAVLGPKIGSFFNNLRGRFDTITMDLWYTRSMHRYLGETTQPMESDRMQELIAKFRNKLSALGARDYGVDKEAAMTDDEAAVKAGNQIMQRWARGNNEYTENTFHKFPDGYEIEKAARDLFNEGGMKGAPQNKSFRNYFADIVLNAKAKLEKMGIKLSEADMQAIVWYAEKNLFAKVGVANEAAKPADYLDAAMVARKNAAEAFHAGEGTTFSISSQAQRDRIYEEFENQMKGAPSRKQEIIQRAAARFGAVQESMDKLNSMIAEKGTERDRTAIRREMEQNLTTLGSILRTLPPEIRGEFGNPYAEYAKKTKDEDKANYLINVIDRAGRAIDTQLRETFVDKAYELYDAAVKGNVPGKAPKNSKISVEGYQELQEIYKLWHMTQDELDKHIDNLNSDLKNVNSDGKLSPEQEDVERNKILQQIGLANIHGNFSPWIIHETPKGKEWVLKDDTNPEKSASESELALKQLDDLIHNARGELKEQKAVRAAEIKTKVAELIKGATGLDETPTSRNKREAQLRGSGVASGIRRLLDFQFSTPQLLDHIFGAKVGQDITDRILDSVMHEHELNRQADHDAMRYIVDMAYGVGTPLDLKTTTKFQKALARLSHTNESGIKVIENRTLNSRKVMIADAREALKNKNNFLSADYDRLIFSLNRIDGNPRSRVTELDLREIDPESGDETTLLLSKLDAMQRLLAWRQPKYRRTLELSGMSDDVAEKLQNYIGLTEDGKEDREAKAFWSFLRDKAYDNYDKINPEFERQFGMSMPRNDNYATTSGSWETAKGKDEAKEPGELGGGASTVPGWAINRTQHSAKYKENNAWTTYLAHTREQNYWLSHVQLNRDLQSTMGSNEVLNAVKSVRADQEGQVKDILKGIAREDQTSGRIIKGVERIARDTVGYGATAILGFNPKVAVKHLTSMTAAAMILDPTEFLQSARNVALGQGALSLKDAYSSDVVQSFLPEHGNPKNALAVAEKGEKIRNLAITGQAIGDVAHSWIPAVMRISNTTTAAIVYDAAFRSATGDGMKPNEAHAYAEKRTRDALHRINPVGFSIDQPFLQQAHPLLAAMQMFAGPARQGLGIALHELLTLPRDIRNAPEGQKLGTATNKVTKALAAWTLPGIMEAAILQGMAALFGSPQEKEDVNSWNEYIAAALAGRLYGFYYIGSTLSNMAKEAITGKKPFIGSPIPAAQYLASMLNSGKKIVKGKGATEDYLSASKAGLDLFSAALILLNQSALAHGIAGISAAANTAKPLVEGARNIGAMDKDNKHVIKHKGIVEKMESL